MAIRRFAKSARKGGDLFSNDFVGAFCSMSLWDLILVIALIILIIGLITYLFARSRVESVESFADDQQISLSGSNVSGAVGGDPLNANDLTFLNNMTPEDVYFVLVYDSRCPHCVNFKPTWKQVSNKYNGQTVGSKRVMFYQVGDAQQMARSQLEQRYGVQGYPTVLILTVDKDEVVSREYDGLREYNYMSQYIEKIGA